MEFNREKRKRATSIRGSNNYYYDCNHHNKDEDFYRISSVVNSTFKKSFTISDNDKFSLPKPESMFNEPEWQIEELQEIKRELNETKSKLNNYCFADWHQHTSQRNKAKDIEWRIRRDFDPEFVTQAWCKFHEIVSKYPLVPREAIFKNKNKFVSLHLCEAPGAFVTCLNHWLKTNAPTIYWEWLAMTLNPYYEGNANGEMISDDRFIIHTLKNWFFGRDNTGNLMVFENFESLVEKSKTKGRVNLITADGSINCLSDPGEQERIVVGLHFCEVVTAMHILEAGGNFLLKIFTTFEHQSLCLIYLLSCVFQKLHFYKPVTSKEGNSEVYLICLNFKGNDFVSPYLPVLLQQYGKNFSKAMFDRNDLPEDFVKQMISCSQLFKNCQCQVIEGNILAYSDFNNLESNYEVKKISKLVADKYIVSFPLQRLHVDLQIVGNSRLKKTKNNHWVVQPPAESFNERQKNRILEPIYRLLMYKEQLKSLEATARTFEFKPATHLGVDIVTSVGKRYDRVQSSRFCPVQIAEVFKLLFQAVDIGKDERVCLPIKENVLVYENGIKELLGDSYEILHFQYTQMYDNNTTLARFEQVLKNLRKGDNLVVFGFLLLTQFNVGLIHLLSHTFETVEFYTNGETGCCINFKTFKSRELILEKFDQVQRVAKTCSTNDLALLSVMTVSELYDSDLYSVVVKLNNWIAKYCVDHVFSIYGETKN